MIIVKYICEGCGSKWQVTKYEEDYTSGGVFYDGDYYGDDGVKRTCPQCGKVLKETSVEYEWEGR